MDEVTKDEIDETVDDPGIALRAAVAATIGAHRRLVEGDDTGAAFTGELARLWLELHERLSHVKIADEAAREFAQDRMASELDLRTKLGKAYKTGFKDGRDSVELADRMGAHKAHADSELASSGTEGDPVI